MKLFILSIFLSTFQIFSAQVGIVTLDANPETVPLGQWYTIRSKDYDNWMAFVDKPEISDSILIEMLAPWELTFEEAEFDDETEFLATIVEKAEAPLEHEPPELDFDFDPNDPNGEEDLLK